MVHGHRLSCRKEEALCSSMGEEEGLALGRQEGQGHAGMLCGSLGCWAGACLDLMCPDSCLHP